MHLARRCAGSPLQLCAARRTRSRKLSSVSPRGFKEINSSFVELHPEVQDALASGKPVVALESTIITHGMPYPVNLNTAKDVEDIVRSAGAIPATVGIIRGQVKIGLEAHEVEYLADSDTTAVKISRRDIAPAIALKRDGVESYSR